MPFVLFVGACLALCGGALAVAQAAPAINSLSPGLASAEQRTPAVIAVGPHRALTRVAQAASIAKSGDVVEVDAGEYPGDVAVWTQSDLTIRAVGGRARIVQRAAAAEGKAIWVVKGSGVVIENFAFAGARAPGQNGSGIRFEGGSLTVRNCLFEDSEMGLLTWNDERATLTIEQSEFRNNAAGSIYHAHDPIGHQIYVGSIAAFTLVGSYIHHGAFGHLVKSRARENRVLYNRLTDEKGGRASYELEFPNGGIAYVLGNIIEQSADTDNPIMVSYGAEGYRWPRNEMHMVNNTLVDDRPGGGRFLSVWAGAGRVDVVNNLFVGNAGFVPNPLWNARGNAFAEPQDLPMAAVYDFRLAPGSRLIGTGMATPPADDGVDLRVQREYVHPMQTRPVGRSPFSPGAIQSVAR